MIDFADFEEYLIEKNALCDDDDVRTETIESIRP